MTLNSSLQHWINSIVIAFENELKVMGIFSARAKCSLATRRRDARMLLQIFQRYTNLFELIVKVKINERVGIICLSSSTDHLCFFLGEYISFHEILEPLAPRPVFILLPNLWLNVISHDVILNNVLQGKGIYISTTFHKIH